MSTNPGMMDQVEGGPKSDRPFPVHDEVEGIVTTAQGEM